MQTALMVAALWGYRETVDMLIKAKADVNRKSSKVRIAISIFYICLNCIICIFLNCCDFLTKLYQTLDYLFYIVHYVYFLFYCIFHALYFVYSP